MYKYVEDKAFLKRAYSDCADTVNRLIQELKKYDIETKMYIVGSKSRNMVTQNERGKIDFDFIPTDNTPEEMLQIILAEYVLTNFPDILS